MTEPHTGATPDTDRIPVQSADSPARAPVPRTEQAATPTSTPEAATPKTTPQAATPKAAASGRVRRTRISGLWVAVTVAAIVLLVLLVFILDNSQSVTVAFFGATGNMPLGVAMLLAAVCGVLLVAIPGYGRIIQLRRAARKGHR